MDGQHPTPGDPGPSVPFDTQLLTLKCLGNLLRLLNHPLRQHNLLNHHWLLINEYLLFDPKRIHPITKSKGSAQLFFVKGNEAYPNGVQHILRETRAPRRVKIGTRKGAEAIRKGLAGTVRIARRAGGASTG